MNYRYRWRQFSRMQETRGRNTYWWRTPVAPGRIPVEQLVKAELAKARYKYALQRREANLPNYILPGPYPITKRFSWEKEVTADINRRMMVYATDARNERLGRMRIRMKMMRQQKKRVK